MKPLLILLVLILSTQTFGKSRLLSISELKNCELVYEATDVRVGQSFEVGLFNPAAKDTALQSISFLALNFEVSGPVKVVRKLGKLKLKVLHESKEEPFITITFKSAEGEKIIAHEIPVIYDQDYQIYYRSKSGKNGKWGRYYWECHIMHDHEIPLNDSDYCKLEYRMDDKIHGKKGQDGMDLEVYVQMVPNGKTSKLIRVEVIDTSGLSNVRHLSPNAGKIWIETVGGNGGDGEGCEKAHYIEHDSTATYIWPTDPELLGQSGNGGNGGRGGDITVHITKEARMFYHQVYLDNNGGYGGTGSADQVSGRPGRKGEMGSLTILDWNP